MADLASARGATPTQAMLAALTQAPFPVVPVVGCRTPEQVASSFAGVDLALDRLEVDLLLAASLRESGEEPP